MVGTRLLLVEDEELERQAIARLLTQAGYLVDAVVTAEEGLVRAERVNYGLVLVDLSLPGVDGFQFIQEFRHRDHLTPILVVTGYGSLEHAMRAMEMDAQGLLSKPLYPNQLLAAVKSTLERCRAAREKLRVELYRPLNRLVALAMAQGGFVERINSAMRLFTLDGGVSRGALYVCHDGKLFLAVLRGRANWPQVFPGSTVAQIEGRLREWGEQMVKEEGYFMPPDLEYATGSPMALGIPLWSVDKLHGMALLERRRTYAPFSASHIKFLWIACSIMAAMVSSATAEQLQALIDAARSSHGSGLW